MRGRHFADLFLFLRPAGDSPTTEMGSPGMVPLG